MAVCYRLSSVGSNLHRQKTFGCGEAGMEFFQNAYFQIAAPAIVVVLLLILILLIRRRHSTTSAEVRSGFGESRRSGTAASLANTQGDWPSPATPTPATGPPAPHAALRPPRTRALDMDPLVATIASMVARPEPLSESDFRRLAIYRPDRVMAAVSSLASAINPDRHAAAKLDKLASLRSYLETPPAEPAALEPAAAEREATAVETEPGAEVAPDGPSRETALSPASTSGYPPRPEPDLTAEQFLQLSEGERASGLPRLPATELGKALCASEDEDVKRQMIDRLVELGTSEALLALDHFLGDAEPSNAQLYALSAAERLLSGGSMG